MHRSTQKILIALFVAAFAVGMAQAWETYGETDSCVTCHGDFRANPYVSLSDGQTWSDSLHEVHQTIVTSECDVCHSAGGRSPVFTGSSRGGFGLSPISCVGSPTAPGCS